MTRPPFTDSSLDARRGHGDPVADAVIADFVRVQGITDPQYVVHQLIQHQRRLPPAEQIPSVRAYFDDSGSVAAVGRCRGAASGPGDLPRLRSAHRERVVLRVAPDELRRGRRLAGSHADRGARVEHPPAPRAHRRDVARRDGCQRRSRRPPVRARNPRVRRTARRAAVPRRGAAHAPQRRRVPAHATRRTDQPGGPARHAHRVHGRRRRGARTLRRAPRRRATGRVRARVADCGISARHRPDRAPLPP